MALILKESEVRRVLTMADGVRLVEEAFRLHARGKTSLAPRLVLPLGGQAGNFRIMAAVVPDLGGFGLKTLTGVPGRRAADETYFAMLLFDCETGALLAMIPAAHLTGVRTGAASGVATKYLAREDARILGLIGAGVQGRSQLDAIRQVRPLEKVKIYDVDELRARAAEQWVASEGLEVSICSSPEETVRGSDIVVSATTSTEPIVRGAWLEAGMHINAIGANAPSKRELDEVAFQRARVVLDFKEQVLQEGGDLLAALRNGAITEDDVSLELGDVVVGRCAGRTSASDITLFKSVGVAIEDVAVAAWVYRQARDRGIGLALNLQD